MAEHHDKPAAHGGVERMLEEHPELLGGIKARVWDSDEWPYRVDYAPDNVSPDAFAQPFLDKGLSVVKIDLSKYGGSGHLLVGVLYR